MFTLNHELYSLRDVNYERSQLTLSGAEPYQLLFEAIVHTTGATEHSPVAVDSQIVIARYVGTLLWYPQNSLRKVLSGRYRVDALVERIMASRHAGNTASTTALFPAK